MKVTIARIAQAIAYHMQASERHAIARAALRDRAGLSPIRTGA